MQGASRARRAPTLRLRRPAHARRGPDPGRWAVASAARPPAGKKPVAGGVRKKGRDPSTEVVAAPAKQVEAVTATSEMRIPHRRVGACRQASVLEDLYEVPEWLGLPSPA